MLQNQKLLLSSRKNCRHGMTRPPPFYTANAHLTGYHIFQCRMKWVKIDGSEFRSGAGFVHSIHEDLPQIGQISDIYLLDEKKLVFKAVNYTTTYHPHFHAYTLTHSPSVSYFCYDKLILLKPVHIRQPQSLPHHKVTVMPYRIDDL